MKTKIYFLLASLLVLFSGFSSERSSIDLCIPATSNFRSKIIAYSITQSVVNSGGAVVSDIQYKKNSGSWTSWTGTLSGILSTDQMYFRCTATKIGSSVTAEINIGTSPNQWATVSGTNSVTATSTAITSPSGYDVNFRSRP
jgi:hypothetical protein